MEERRWQRFSTNRDKSSAAKGVEAMNVHSRFAEDLALYALGMLEGNEQVELEKHLKDCADCRHELEQLRGDAALLALSASGPAPPQRARGRLMNALTREPRISTEQPSMGGISWWSQMAWVTAAVAIVIAAVLWRTDASLSRRMANLQKEFNEQQTELQRAQEVTATLTATDALRVTIISPKAAAQPQDRAIYVPSRSSLIFLANNMPALPARRAYELWIIPITGSPIPAGVFKPDAHGNATVVNPHLPPGVETKTFAITVEPETGSQVLTSTPIMLGTGE
jgi:anti-sigma-K factor RskA